MMYLKKEEIIYINQLVINNAHEGSLGIQYNQGLDLVVEQPQMVVFGRPLYPNIWMKAAYILQKITKKHIFSDGNKRTSFISTKLFLKKNGYNLVVSKDEGVSLMLKSTTAEDNEQEMENIAKFLKAHAQKI